MVNQCVVFVMKRFFHQVVNFRLSDKETFFIRNGGCIPACLLWKWKKVKNISVYIKFFQKKRGKSQKRLNYS